MNERVVFARLNEGRHSIHVGGKDDVGRAAGIAGEDVEALAGGAALGGLRDFHFLDGESVVGEEFSEKCADCALVVGDGLDVDETPRELNGIEAHAATGYPTRVRGMGCGLASYNGC